MVVPAVGVEATMGAPDVEVLTGDLHMGIHHTTAAASTVAEVMNGKTAAPTISPHTKRRIIPHILKHHTHRISLNQPHEAMACPPIAPLVEEVHLGVVDMTLGRMDHLILMALPDTLRAMEEEGIEVMEVEVEAMEVEEATGATEDMVAAVVGTAAGTAAMEATGVMQVQVMAGPLKMHTVADMAATRMIIRVEAHMPQGAEGEVDTKHTTLTC